MNGYTPHRRYKAISDLTVLQMVTIVVPLLGLFVLLGADRVTSTMMIPSIVLIVIFCALCLFPSSVNYGTKMIVSIMYSWRYMLIKLYERMLMIIEKNHE